MLLVVSVSADVSAVPALLWRMIMEPRMRATTTVAPMLIEVREKEAKGKDRG